MNQSFRPFTVLFVLLALPLGVFAQTASEKIYPDSTKGFFVIRNLKELGEQWKKTQIGTLMNDPIMKEFKEDVQKQFDERMLERFGLTLDGIEALPSGEVAAGMIASPDKIPGYVFSMDIKDRLKEANTYLDNLVKKLQGLKVNVKTIKSGRSTITELTFPSGNAEAVEKDDETVDERRKVYYAVADNHLVASDQMYLLQLIVDRIADAARGVVKNSLADTSAFQTTMKRCQDDLPQGATPEIRWFIDPLNYGESIRVVLQNPAAKKRKNKPSIFTILKQQGFDAVQGIGGVVSIKAEEKETIYRVFAYAKKPFRLAMRMLSFPDGKDFTPPKWIPQDTARSTTFYVDPLAIFENFGTLFDSFMQQGEGMWADIVRGLEEDQHGPKINIRKEIIEHLGQRAVGMSHYQVPITAGSESLVVAVELGKGRDEAMIAALKKLFGNDTDMTSTKHHSYVLWHRVPVQVNHEPPKVVGVPDLVPVAPITKTVKNKTVKRDDDDEEEERPPVFPDGAVTVAKGRLFVCTNKEYLKGILDRLDEEPKTSMQDHTDYQRIHKVFEEMGIADKIHFFQFFSRTDATIQPTYELVRLNRMNQSQAVLGKLLNGVLAPEDENGRRKPLIDGKNLPEFDKVKDYFGPTGIFGVSEDNGFFFKGFLLEKK